LTMKILKNPTHNQPLYSAKAHYSSSLAGGDGAIYPSMDSIRPRITSFSGGNGRSSRNQTRLSDRHKELNQAAVCWKREEECS
jgi:hypothetical protein